MGIRALLVIRGWFKVLPGLGLRLALAQGLGFEGEGWPLGLGSKQGLVADCC